MIKDEKIKFNKTSNPLYNVGIIGLAIWLKKLKGEYNYEYLLKDDYLEIKSDDLISVLEEVYHQMGKYYYDSPTKSQLEENGNAYYDKEKDKFVRFPKMNTLGMARLINNNAQGTTKIVKNTIKKKELIKNDEKLFKKFEKYFEDNKLKMLNKLYFNEPYHKITRIDFNEKYLKTGKKRCTVTGENYRYLVNAKCTTPFLGEMINFGSYFKDNRKIGWKTSFIFKFSPVLCFYNYENLKKEKLDCYFIEGKTLEKTYTLYNGYKTLFLEKEELLNNDYLKNFNTINFTKQKKSEEERKKSDFTLKNEVLFCLIYSIYRRHLFALGEVEDDGFDYDDYDAEKENFKVTYFTSKSFDQTMRANSFEVFNDYKYLISFFEFLEGNEIGSLELGKFLFSLKYIKKSEKNTQNNWSLERKQRDKILELIIRKKLIYKTIENLLYSFYLDNLNNNMKRRSYSLIFKIFKLYEKFIKYGGGEMNEELSKKSLNLGSSIGISIKNNNEIKNESDDKKARRKKEEIKKGKKYIISLRKVNTYAKFLGELERIQSRYNLIINEKLLININDKNWNYIKSYVVIGALNSLNMEFLPKGGRKNND